MRQKPAVDPGDPLEFINRHPLLQGILDIKDARSVWLAQTQQHFFVSYNAIIHRIVKPGMMNFQPTQALLQSFLEGAPDSHGLSDRFHLHAQNILGFRKFLKRKTRNFDNTIINNRLK